MLAVLVETPGPPRRPVNLLTSVLLQPHLPSLLPLPRWGPSEGEQDACCRRKGQGQGLSYWRPNVIILLEKRIAPWMEPVRRRRGLDSGSKCETKKLRLNHCNKPKQRIYQ